jgi:hypothetical protein
MWVICAHEAIGQSLELAFQTIFAGAVTIRHRGSAESCRWGGRQFSKWVADRFSVSADMPHYLRSQHSVQKGERAVAWLSVKSAKMCHRKQWSMEKCEKGKPNMWTPGDEGMPCSFISDIHIAQEQQMKPETKIK